MKLRTVVQDGLFLNWALPLAALPAPPAPLRYEVHRAGGEGFVFASAVLFHAHGLHWPGLPWLRLSYPQFNLRLYVVDGEGAPAVLFRRVLLPVWVVPAARAIGHQPAVSARFRYPRPSRQAAAGSWRWWVRRRAAFAVEARQGPPATGPGPRFGSWEETVHYIRHRSRGYALAGSVLRRVETEQPRAALWPLSAVVAETGLLTECLPLAGAAWPDLHSAWLCPEIPLTFDLSVAPQLELSHHLPHAAASSRSGL
jgi:uncharacterized protein YqjF (DUF2071 family)